MLAAPVLRGGYTSRGGGTDWRARAQVKASKEYVPLEAACSLFARKFDARSIDAVLWAAMDCREGFAWHRTCM